MKNSIKAALITGILGIVGTVSAAIIGVYAGKSTEQKNIQNEINEAMGDVVNIVGDGNNVTINDIKELIKDYQKLKEQNDSLTAQNTKYFDDLTNANKNIDELNTQVDSSPIFSYNNLGLCIGGEDISINKSNSMVTIDGRDYVSKEIMENIIPDDQNVTIKDDTIYIGKVVADKANLSDQNILNKSMHLVTNYTGKDSYGNTRTNAILNGYYGENIIYTLNKKYSYLRCNISMSEDYSISGTTTITVSSDENIVYSCDINKKTEPYDIEIPINNCSLLTIDFHSDSGNSGCIISEAIVYN